MLVRAGTEVKRIVMMVNIEEKSDQKVLTDGGKRAMMRGRGENQRM